LVCLKVLEIGRGVESLIEVPQAMTHQSDSAAAVLPDLVRLSSGIEAAEDLVADLERALVA
jgi:cystathionine gamma-synthase